MPHLLEILKIIEGAVNADPKRAAAYAEQLAVKLDAEGQPRAAASVRRTVSKSRALEVTSARLESRMKAPPVDGESRHPLADEDRLESAEAAVVLPEAVRTRVEEFIAFVKAADRLIARGVGIAPSLLVYGPPGCGKTQLARHIASRLELPLITARIDALISSFLGSTAKNLRSLFEHALGRPCVLFLDEFDAIAKLRDDRQELGELKRVVVSLLQNIDALDGRTVVIAATNHEHLLDAAVWRRFGFKLHLELPDLEARRALFAQFLGSAVAAKELEALAVAGDALTGADIRQASEDATRGAIVSGRDSPTLPEILSRIADLRLRDHGRATALAERLKRVKALAPGVYTNRRLSEMFGVSVGQVSNLLRATEPTDVQ